MSATNGLHHVTAIAGRPQANIDFYVTALGLRLVKRTVNFDAPGTYHLYYGDAQGSPGSLMTFFPWQDVRPGRIGAGQSTSTAFSVPAGSLGWWQGHLRSLSIDSTVTTASSSEERLLMRDPDGLQLELVATDQQDPRDPWDTPSVPAEHAVRGQHSLVLTVRRPEATVRVLTEDLGLTVLEQRGNLTRLVAGEGSAGNVVDVVGSGLAPDGLTAGGTVHHIAFRVPDHAAQEVWRAQLVDAGFEVTAILDRQYFTSIYFREPGGVLFEMATDTPGFAIDEPLLELGRSLKLPPWLEPRRDVIEQHLPPIVLPGQDGPPLDDAATS